MTIAKTITKKMTVPKSRFLFLLFEEALPRVLRTLLEVLPFTNEIPPHRDSFIISFAVTVEKPCIEGRRAADGILPPEDHPAFDPKKLTPFFHSYPPILTYISAKIITRKIQRGKEK